MTSSTSIDFHIPKDTLDLQPGKWVWYPSNRTLPNTFVLFRREIELSAQPKCVTGWIVADSRYCLYVNDKRIQWGPAPCDPRWMEADPLDLTKVFTKGKNVVGAQVLFYGFGDGTWPFGKPGFLCRIDVEYTDGRKEVFGTDKTWLSHMARAWKPGHYKRWFLRALQEEFDARLYPYGWSAPDFKLDKSWLNSMELQCTPGKPSICSDYSDYLNARARIYVDDTTWKIGARQIPMMRETIEPVIKLTESLWIDWKHSPEEYFECETHNAFEAVRSPCAQPIAEDKWKVRLDASHPQRAAALTFEMKEQMVGWPRFTIEAPAGTVIELMVHEGHAPGGAPLLNTYFHSWARFICRQGRNEFETFDFESCRWIQLHIRNADGEIKISNVGIRRRVFPWKLKPKISLSEPALQRLMNAGINTLNNCAQETCVDGMGRERQQYSGDGAHQLHAIRMTMGEQVLPARFLRTFSQGMTVSGCFLDSWPAYDRLNRLSFREIGLGKWGAIIDHGIGFNFDCMYHYLYTGDLTVLEEPYPKLQKFAHYLKSIQSNDSLLAVDDIGIGSVWMDHSGFQQQHHKQCAFNLYAAAMLKNAYAILCEAFGDNSEKKFAETFSEELYKTAVKHFWSEKHQLFVDNLPWLKKEKNIRLHDRTLATSLLFDQCPRGKTSEAIQVLIDCPSMMGFSYPCNAGWRLWALGKTGRADVVLKELRTRWAKMDSVLLNNSLQEGWRVRPDSRTMWSHCAVVPLYVLHMSIAGIRPLSPGFNRCEFRPQLVDLEKLKLTTYTVKGPIEFNSEGSIGNRQVTITMPQECCGELVVKKQEKLNLEAINTAAPPEHVRYRLPKNRKVSFQLKYS